MKKLLIVLSAGLGFGSPLLAQRGATGMTEVAGFGGFVGGIGTHPVIGGGIGYSTTRHLMPSAEFSYIPGDPNAYDFNAGMHVRFPRRGHTVVPYVMAGLGLLHTSASNRSAGQLAVSSSTSFLVNFGAGLRYYVTDRWGLRPELKIFAGDTSYARFSVGVFYQFR